MLSPSSMPSASQSHCPAIGAKRILPALLLILTGSATFAQTTSTWTGGAGNWAPCPASGGTALWDTCSTNVYPDGNFNAVIDGGPVALGTGDGISIDNLTLASGESLIITPGYLDITGTSIMNNGSISVGIGNGLTVEGTTTVTLSGTGTVTISDATAHIAGANGSPAFGNQQTIQGQGALGEGTLATLSLAHHPLWIPTGDGGPTHLGPVETCGPVGLAHSISYLQYITVSSLYDGCYKPSPRSRVLVRCLPL